MAASASDRRWKHRAGVQVLSHVLRQIRPTTRAEVRTIPEKVRAKLLLPEGLRAGRALGNRVTRAVLEEDRALFMTQVSWSSAVDVEYLVAVERDRVID